MQHAVDPVADGETVLERLDVDVGRSRIERIGDDVRDEADDRRLGREILQLLHVGVEREIVAALLDVAHDLPDGGAVCAVQPLERRIELARNCDPRLHLAAGEHAKRADRVLVGRIGHREGDLVLVLVERQCARLAQEARRDALLENREFGIAGRVDEREAELERERLGDVALRGQPERDEQRAQLFAAVLLDAQRAIEPGRVELAALDQDLADALSSRCIHRFSQCTVGLEKERSIIAQRSPRFFRSALKNQGVARDSSRNLSSSHDDTPRNCRRRPTTLQHFESMKVTDCAAQPIPLHA